MHFIRIILLALGLLAASPALALLPSAPEPSEAPAADTSPEPEIDQGSDTAGDARITERIRGIFSELPDFQDVSVRTSEGVVTLSGTLPDADAIARAENIAGRVSGVVTVQNGIERDLSVDGNLSIIGKVSSLIEDLVNGLPLFGLALLVAIAIGAIGYLIAGLHFIWDRVAPNAFLGELIRSAIRFAFVVGGIVVALDMIGASALLGAVLGGAGVIGLALGFAMRDTVENYVASLMLSLRQPFRAKDHVIIGEHEGRVIRLTSRATVLMTLDGNHLRIPNGDVFKATILNYTTNPKRRFDFELGVDADDDPDAARRLGRATLAKLDFVLADPPPEARTEQVGDSNIVIRYLAWIDQNEADWYKARSRAIAAVKSALEDGGFALPEPIYRLRFDGRTDPLPIGRSTATSASVTEAAPRPSPAPAAPDEHHEDVSPDTEITRMVEEERSTEDDSAKDLLDHSRPVE